MEHTCQNCGHQWEPRREVPVRCPSCKSVKWNIPKDTMYLCPVCDRLFDKKVACSTHIRRKGGGGHGKPGEYVDEPRVWLPPEYEGAAHAA